MREPTCSYVQAGKAFNKMHHPAQTSDLGFSKVEDSTFATLVDLWEEFCFFAVNLLWTPELEM